MSKDNTEIIIISVLKFVLYIFISGILIMKGYLFPSLSMKPEFIRIQAMRENDEWLLAHDRVFQREPNVQHPQPPKLSH